MSDLETQFKTAAAAAQNLSQRPSNDDLLKLYAYYKQATQGQAGGKRPGFTDPVGRAKYDAWKKLGSLSAEEAMRAYIDLVERLKQA
ncbi:MAG: acyl-CoA-binding protein [Ardenticatenaceae bacterium]|nr:acyl-CoA-binding protein [Anaerolineales bacterium]MCB8984246.1 acyl-CoA-binding protein [Ardenticatenaceae bacterium]